MLGLGAVMILFSIGTSLLAGWRGVHEKRWSGGAAAAGLFMVGLLHLLQPVARTIGRVQGRWALRRSTLRFTATDLLEGDLPKREIWLQRLMAHMKSCGWVVRPGSEWEEADLVVLGPGPYTLRLTSVYEEDLQRALHYVRYRVTAKMKLQAPLVVGCLMAALVAMTQALYLAPLAVPIVFVLRRYVKARETMIQAVSQMAMECGWPIGMPKAKTYH
jgi:hypothetical protein